MLRQLKGRASAMLANPLIIKAITLWYAGASHADALLNARIATPLPPLLNTYPYTAPHPRKSPPGPRVRVLGSLTSTIFSKIISCSQPSLYRGVRRLFHKDLFHSLPPIPFKVSMPNYRAALERGGSSLVSAASEFSI